MSVPSGAPGNDVLLDYLLAEILSQIHEGKNIIMQ